MPQAHGKGARTTRKWPPRSCLHTKRRFVPQNGRGKGMQMPFVFHHLVLKKCGAQSMTNTSQTSITRMVPVDQHNHATPTMQGVKPPLFESACGKDYLTFQAIPSSIYVVVGTFAPSSGETMQRRNCGTHACGERDEARYERSFVQLHIPLAEEALNLACVICRRQE